MSAGRTSPSAARDLRDEARRLLRLQIAATWTSILVLSIAGAALLGRLLFAPPGWTLPRALFSWASFLLISFLTAAGWRRARRRERVDRLARENLLLNYPAQRKQMEAWLSTDLVGRRTDLVLELLELRLHRSLLKTRWVPLKRSCFLAMALVGAGIAALAVIAIPLDLAGGIDCYLRALFPGAGEPPRITGLSLKERWVRESELDGLEVTFDRDLTVTGQVLIRRNQDVESSDLVRLSPGRYRAQLSPRPGRLSLKVVVGARSSPELECEVYPRRPIEVTEVRWFDSKNKELGSSLAEPSQLVVPEGALVRFRVRVASCPLVAFGLGGKKSGELGLSRLPSGDFAAEIEVAEDETFRTFWQMPGGPAELGSEVAVRIHPVPPPEPRLLFPGDGDLATARAIRVSCRSTYGGTVARGFVLSTDYRGVQWGWEVPVEKVGDGEWGFDFELPLDRLDLGQARVLGVCAALRAEGRLEKTGFSPIANLLLPRRTGTDLARAGQGRPGTLSEITGDPGSSAPVETWLDGDSAGSMASELDEAQAGGLPEDRPGGARAPPAEKSQIARPAGPREACEECEKELASADPTAQDGEKRGERVCEACASRREKEGRCRSCGGT